MDYQKLFDAAISDESVKAWRGGGKKAVGTVCCHTPYEVIYAAGVLPVRLRATGCIDSSEGEAWMSSFSCSFSRSILEYLINGKYDLDGLAMSDGCMMASRIYDNWEHVSKKQGKSLFFRQVGAPRINNEMTQEYFKSELSELIADLEKWTGNKVTDEALKAAVGKYNEIRALIAQVNELRKAEKPVISGADALALMIKFADCSPDEYIELLKAFLADAPNRAPIESKVRVMVIGSALDNPEYIRVIEEKGALVVAEDLCFGTRNFGPELVVDDADVLGSIAKFYMDRNSCPRNLDNRPAMHKEIIAKCKEFGVQGVIYEKMQNCECWGGESYYLEPDLKDAGIPMLQLEREEHMANAGQLAVRAEAFVEMIDK
jgi:benzoyl-CoA reductase/2-hydroxyglutaryl-CoA dehydratase subunit BcrC/BadD/HgdB